MPGESLQDVISEEELVIGYFPTHRNREYEIKIENILRLDELNGVLESKNAKMVIKPHRSLDMISVQEDYENIKEIPQSTDSHVFLDKIDILITDYSSIYFDFLLVGGPVIFYTHDRDQYTKMRGLHPKYDEVTIGHHTKEPDELVEILDQLIIGKDTYKNERKEIRDEFFKYNDRQSSKRLYKSITTDQLD
jgi:CDP-glycerol glycerophosphotransferase (TagB/SpsB family)